VYKAEKLENQMIRLENNQAALILETTEDGEISVNVASGDVDGLSGAICQIIAMKLMDDEEFQAEIMDILDQYQKSIDEQR
jgi:ribosomal protein S9